MKHLAKKTVEIEGAEIVVTYIHHDFLPGARERPLPGRQLEPDEPDWFEIVEAKIINGSLDVENLEAYLQDEKYNEIFGGSYEL